MSTHPALDYTAAEHLQEFLELQHENAQAIRDYTARHTPFSDGLGVLIRPVGAIGDFVTDQGVTVAGWVSDFFDTVAVQVGHVKDAVQQADEQAMAELWGLAGDLPAPAAGGVDSVWDRGHQQRAAPRDGTGALITIPAPEPGDDPMPGIRSRLGPIVGLLDEFYTRFIGRGSLIEKYLFEPLAGDWAEVGRAADAWGKAGTGYSSMADQLVVYSLPTDWWEGAAAEAFQSLMGLARTAADWMRWAHEMVGRGVGAVTRLVIAACEQIADIIGYLERIATRALSRLKVPVVGWGSLVWNASDYIDEFNGYLSDIEDILDEVRAAVADAEEMRQEFLDKITQARELSRWVTSIA